MAYEGMAYYYDQLMAHMPYPEWMKFLTDSFEKYGQPQSMVDLGCGTGAIAIPLTHLGIRVYGVDLSEDMLSVANHKWIEVQSVSGRRKNDQLILLQQDMREFVLPETVDMAVCLCDGLNYLLEEDELRLCFSRVYDSLSEEGLFIFDVHTAAFLKHHADNQPYVMDEEDIAYIWTCEYDKNRLEIIHDLTIFAAEGSSSFGQTQDRFNRIRETHVQRAYPLETITDLLKASGFDEVHTYCDFTWNPPKPESDRAFFVAHKK